MKEVQNTDQLPGRSLDAQGISQLANALWNNLSLAERERYERMARENRNSCPETKLTNIGISYAQHRRAEQEKEEKQRQMNLEIETTVRNLDRAETLQKYCFYFAHVNFFCRTEKGEFFPCEIALAEFSLEKGIQRTYHSFINCGRLPIGFTFEAQTRSEETHRIELPPMKIGNKDYADILRRVRSFLTGNQSKTPNMLPPLYTKPACEECVSNVLSQFCTEAKKDPSDYRVYLLPKLFYELRNAAASGEQNSLFPAQSIAERELEDDVFTFTRGISCEWHQESDAFQYCSLSLVKRWCFIVADHCCQLLGIDLVPGHHCPQMADTNRFSRFKIVTNPTATGRPRSSGRRESPEQQSPRKHVDVPEHENETTKQTNDYDSSDDDAELRPIRRPMTKGLARYWAMYDSAYPQEDIMKLIQSENVGRGAFASLPENAVAVAGRGVGPGRNNSAGKAPAGHGRGRGMSHSQYSY